MIIVKTGYTTIDKSMKDKMNGNMKMNDNTEMNDSEDSCPNCDGENCKCENGRCKCDPKECSCECCDSIMNNKNGDMFKSIVIALIEKEKLDPVALSSWLKTIKQEND